MSINLAKFAVYALLLGCAIHVKPSFALAKLGHQLVCQLAFEQLTASQQQQVNTLLLAIPAKEQQRINRYNRIKKHSPITYSSACTWADAIKKESQYQQYRSWHYLNIPRNATKVSVKHCQKDCLPHAILHHQQQLKSAKDSWQKSQALLFLGHWLGDIHQPLHVSYASDLGGNKVKLKNKQSRCNNLHWYWDQCVLSQAKLNKKQWISELKTLWPKVNITENAKRYEPSQVWFWANESYQIIRQPSFQYCEIESDTKTCKRPSKKITLADNYQEQHLPLMKQQLVKAAKRLHRVLDASL